MHLRVLPAFTFAFCLLTFSFVPAVPNAQTPTERRPTVSFDWLREWLAAVDGHEPGLRDASAIAVGLWSRRELEALYPDVRALVEVMTDKATVEIPCSAEGKVVKILAQEGQVVKVGGALLKMETGAGASAARFRASCTPMVARDLVHPDRDVDAAVSSRPADGPEYFFDVHGAGHSLLRCCHSGGVVRSRNSGRMRGTARRHVTPARPLQ